MTPGILYIIWLIFQSYVAFVLLFPVISWLLYSIKGKRVERERSVTENDFAIIVTAYKETSNLPNVVNSLLQLNYSNYLVYVVADNCQPFDLGIEDDRVIVLYPDPVLENQVKSHFYAINNFKRAHTTLTIIDSDNLVDPGYLKAINQFFEEGYEAVQGVRKAKNFDTPYACLDAANEIYYLFYDRKILFELGSSCMLTGSGMAFTLRLFNECLAPLNTSGAGFDKVLQYHILNRGYRIAFAEKAIVYDEKTSKADQLVKQRARWNNTWFRYFKFGLMLVAKGIKNFSLNQLLFGFILLRPPTFILLMLSVAIMLVNVFVSYIAAAIWFGSLLLFTFGFFLALARSKTDKRVYQALKHIPKFIFLQVLSLFKARKANQFSVATEHHYNKEIEEIE